MPPPVEEEFDFIVVGAGKSWAQSLSVWSIMLPEADLALQEMLELLLLEIWHVQKPNQGFC